MTMTDDGPGRETESASPGQRWGVSPDGFRLPPDTRLGRVRVQVADLDRSVSWYEEILGFRPTPLADSVVGLSTEAGEEPLIELHEKKGVAPVPRHGRLGLYHFAILLPDRPALGQFVAHLDEQRMQGAEVGGVGAADHLVSEALYLHDPDGLGVEVYADRPPSAWRHSGRQLVMATDPLDLEDLVRAGGDKRWTGMPTGTTMGHIHLHVGDLDEASAFYHQGLGLDRMVWSYPGALFLAAGGYHHHLGVNTWARGASPAGEEDACLLEWELVVPSIADIQEAVRSADAGVPNAEDSVLIRDPWGTALRIRVPQV